MGRLGNTRSVDGLARGGGGDALGECGGGDALGDGDCGGGVGGLLRRRGVPLISRERLDSHASRVRFDVFSVARMYIF